MKKWLRDNEELAMAVLGWLVVIAGAVALFGCNDGGTAVTPQPPPIQSIILPPMNVARSDFISPTEGLPLTTDPNGCTLPVDLDWQKGLCGNPLVKNYPNTNWFKSGPDHDVWRVAINNEPSWGGDQGPPNQSRPIDGKPFGLGLSADHVILRLDGVNDGKIPYMGINYLRGVQGDPVPRLGKWGDRRFLEFDADFKSSGGQQWFMLWLFFDKNGKRLMLRHDIISPASDKISGEAYWNWPAVNSYYYPGAKLFRKAQPDQPLGHFVLDVEMTAWGVSPEFIGADFLGAEWAIEQAPGPGWSELRLSGVRVR